MIAYYNENILARDIRKADNFFSRLRGLLGKKNINIDEGLLLMNCPSVHCFFMKFTIDVVYLSKEMKVIGIETLSPWKVGKYIKKSAHVLELAEGVAANSVSIGDTIIVNDL